MKKSKKEYKKELKEKMKGKMKTKLKTKLKRKIKKFKIMFIIFATLAAVVAAIKFVLALIEKKHKKDPNREGLKDVTAFFSSKSWDLAEPVKGGFLVGGYFSNLSLDLSNCDLADNSFIAIKGAVSRINIVLPENVNVKFDGIGSAYYMKKEYDENAFDESFPTVYVAMKVAFSCVFISKEAPVVKTVEDETTEG